ncbi:MAG: FAD-dependent oxidoreductase [Patescibacteria group bacterium]|nr:FAD-dependent oxidoreductase [Patescibacteria group bacterium]MDD4304386.1 FAD-dependent oxidoreductase [Patescibacteria group bacterium]MDD4695409.1 FAD-dependent oxidoreductase [Patescibacteria group bacterium]
MKYDLIIIGVGPAGYSASIYASRYKTNHIIIGEIPGGLATIAHKVCNYPSEIEISGIELMEKMKKNVEHSGTQIINDKVLNIEKDKDSFKIKTQDEKEYKAKTILLAIGTKHRKLGLKNESQFVGKGVSYCATCDAMFYKDKTVVVVGGSNSAMTASLYLADVAKKVYQIYRGGKLKGENMWQDQIFKNEKIEVIYNTNIEEINGEKKVQSIKLDREYNNSKELNVDGIFIEIGSEPDYGLIEQLNIETDENGFIKVKSNQSTNIEGIYAAGDITNGSDNFRQIITACSEGSVAANSIYKYLQLKK